MLNKQILLSSTSKPRLRVKVLMNLSSPAHVHLFEFWSLSEKPSDTILTSLYYEGTYYFDIPSIVASPPPYIYLAITFESSFVGGTDLVNMEPWTIPPGSFRKGIRVVDPTKDASISIQTSSGGVY